MDIRIILKISIVLQLLVALLALGLIPVIRKRLAWIVFSVALLLMAARRIITLWQPETFGLLDAGDLAAELVALFTSALLLVGIAWIAPLFRSIQRTKDALAQSEAKYRELVENANSIILRLDPQGRITFFNEFAQRFFGYPEKEILGREMVGLIVPPRDRQGRDLAAMVTDLVQNPERYATHEHENMRRNGEAVWVSWTNKALRDVEGRLTEILCIGKDSTAYKRAQEELLEQSWLLDAFYEHTITPLVILDKNFNYIRVNQAYARACQRDVSEFPGKNHFALYPSEAEAIFVRTVESKKPYQAFARPFNFPDHPEWGVTYWDWTLVPILDKQNEVEFLVLSLKNVTSRQRAAEALKESEEKYRLLVNNIPALVFKGYADWTVDFFDRKIEELTGYPKEDFDSRKLKWSELILPEDLPGTQEAVAAALKGDKSYEREYRILAKDGKTLWIHERSQIICDASGSFAHISGVFYDISRSKETEQALQLSEEQLLQAQKMEAVGRLAGGVAHDFNNLLTGIIGYAELMLRRLDDQDPLRGNVEEIRKAGERASSLIRQLLAFSRKQILQPKRLNLNTVVRDMENLLQRLIGEDIYLVTDLEAGLGMVEADPSQIEQVVINLVVNARDAMPLGGKLTIETANVDLDDSYAHRDVNFQAGSYVMLAVSDNGVGMDEETQAHIFEPFFTTKASNQGTGLGLSTVYGIVKQSGGYIWVYSEPKWGTTFKIYLPLTISALEMEQNHPEMAAPPQGWETVLLVEDEELVRQMVFDALIEKGYQVYMAENAEEALTFCDQFKGRIHLLLTDVVMPGLSGRQLAERLVLRYPDLKVMYISGYGESAISHHGVLDPGIAFLAKPFTPNVLIHRVRKVLDMPSFSPAVLSPGLKKPLRSESNSDAPPNGKKE
ncbi:MAG: PAS domain S-box protein [Syntrophales bacterium]|nr:PAS domain S-box protein [Syntrophales bacterium]